MGGAAENRGISRPFAQELTPLNSLPPPLTADTYLRSDLRHLRGSESAANRSRFPRENDSRVPTDEGARRRERALRLLLPKTRQYPTADVHFPRTRDGSRRRRWFSWRPNAL